MSERDGQGNEVHQIEVGEEWRRPFDDGKPVFGTRRLVSLIPTPVGAFPAIWMASNPHRGRNGKPCRNAVILIQKDPPQTMSCEIEVEGVDKLPLVPIEW